MDPTFGDLKELRLRMVRWAKSLTRGGANAEDLVQTALVKMLANRHRAPARLAEMDPWARGILINVFRDDRRSQHRLPGFVDLDDVTLRAAENPETSTYCRQVFGMLGLDASTLLGEPGRDFTSTQRVQRYRARQAILQVAA